MHGGDRILERILIHDQPVARMRRCPPDSLQALKMNGHLRPRGFSLILQIIIHRLSDHFRQRPAADFLLQCGSEGQAHPENSLRFMQNFTEELIFLLCKKVAPAGPPAVPAHIYAAGPGDVLIIVMRNPVIKNRRLEHIIRIVLFSAECRLKRHPPVIFQIKAADPGIRVHCRPLQVLRILPVKRRRQRIPRGKIRKGNKNVVNFLRCELQRCGGPTALISCSAVSIGSSAVPIG